jgi:hypothetical protein
MGKKPQFVGQNERGRAASGNNTAEVAATDDALRIIVSIGFKNFVFTN